MKKLLLFFMLTTFGLSAFSQGIIFEENHDLSAALAKAKAENKLVFIDAYAQWCGPCKMMVRDIFPLKEVGDYYNSHFVNLKLDMETPENLDIAKKYEVKAYPTYLFLDTEGNVVHKALGGMPADKFIEVAKVATDGENNFAALDRKIKNGDRTLATVRSYVSQNPYDKGNGALVDSYFNTLSDDEIYSEENWQLFTNYVNDISSPTFQYFLQNRGKIAGLVGKEKTDAKILKTLANAYYQNPSQEEKLKTIDPELFAKAKASVDLSKAYGKFYANKDDKSAWEGFLNVVNPYLAQSNDPNELNSMAWMVYENYKKFNDKIALKNALNWAKKAVELAPEKSHIIDTYAHLLHASGKKKEAIKLETKAMEIAQQVGDTEGAENYKKAIESFKAKKK